MGEINLELCGDVGRKVIEYNVGRLNKIIEDAKPSFIFEVDCDTAFVSVQRDVVSTLTAKRIIGIARQEPSCALALKRFHFDRIGTQICENHASIGTREHM